jgi:hypothetical protein
LCFQTSKVRASSILLATPSSWTILRTPVHFPYLTLSSLDPQVLENLPWQMSSLGRIQPVRTAHFRYHPCFNHVSWLWSGKSLYRGKGMVPQVLSSTNCRIGFWIDYKIFEIVLRQPSP